MPSVVPARDGWQKGRYRSLVRWVARMYEKGAIICSACSSVFLLAETGLFDGKAATKRFQIPMTGSNVLDEQQARESARPQV